MAHLEEQQSKMVALAGGLHRRLGAESVVLRLDDNLLQLIWEQVERRCVVPRVEEEVDEEEEEEDEEEDEEDEEEDETARTQRRQRRAARHWCPARAHLLLSARCSLVFISLLSIFSSSISSAKLHIR